MDKLWRDLLTKEVLTRGWHLARLDTRQGFADDLYASDVYGVDLPLQIHETINRLETETYQPRPLLGMEVPKGSLAFRPGTVIPIHDRVVVSAIVLLMAPTIEEKLPESVYSWRLKEPLPKKGPIFRETDITEVPFLKKATIRERVDPFESWYDLWPEFDRKSRSIFLHEGYRYLATSDIAAYFENIQLPILRDQLLRHFPRDPRIVNLLCTFLESWTVKTADGRPHLRGIPQGNFVSSFLGNLFLLPLDETLEAFRQDHDVLYYRYMDDVRVFARRMEDARLAIFTMNRTLRGLHLNVQTAKTRIYDERRGEITATLIDERVDELSELIEEIQDNSATQEMPRRVRARYLGRLTAIAKADARGSQKILGARRPLEGLSLRAFGRWITAHCLLRSDRFVGRLLNEIERNADHKLTKKLLTATRLFPRKRGIEAAILTFLQSGRNIFPHQEAECLRALRYLSRLHSPTFEHCVDRLRNQDQDRYVRMQAAYLLSRTELAPLQIRRFEQLFETEQDPYVQVALSTLLAQRRKKNAEIVQRLVFHPNEKVSDVGKLYRCVKNDEKVARERLDHMFREETAWLACDNMVFVHLMCMSENVRIRRRLADAIRAPRRQHPIGDIRDILQHVFTRTLESLKRERDAAQ